MVIAAHLGFAHLWLLPRLPRLEAAFPDRRFEVLPVDGDVAAHHARTDLVIRFGAFSTAGPDDLPLLAERVVPASSRELARRYDLADALDAETLTRTPLLHMDAGDPRWLDWPRWAELAGLPAPPPGRFFYRNYPLLLRAAMDGQGLALVCQCLGDDRGDGGSLQRLSPVIERPDWGLPATRPRPRHRLDRARCKLVQVRKRRRGLRFSRSCPGLVAVHVRAARDFAGPCCLTSRSTRRSWAGRQHLPTREPAVSTPEVACIRAPHKGSSSDCSAARERLPHPDGGSSDMFIGHGLCERLLAPFLVLLLLAAAVPAAIADNGGPDVEHGHSHSHGPAISEAKIAAFAEAAGTIERISQRYQPKIQAAREAGDEAKMRAHAGKAREEMTKAIQRQSGLSVQEYRTIARHARQDTDLAAEIRTRMRKAEGKATGG